MLQDVVQQNEQLLSRIEQKLVQDQSAADAADDRLEAVVLQCEQERQEHQRTHEQVLGQQ